ncbi:MAG: hypothetical protein EU542_09210 [Promethearchaeota archaeon]|nr:MAG: hypothetical protein EU542_09210 [Candidatus Lokiarchaeota archaeon]
MTLTILDIVNGSFGLLFVVISVLLGLVIISKYFETKNSNFLLVGLTWILLASGWYGTTVSFLIALSTGGEGISYELIMLLNFIPLPFALITWMIAFTNFLYKDYQKIVVILCLIIVVVFHIVFLYYLFTDPIVVGEKISPVDTKANNPIFGVFLIILVAILFISGIKFSLETMKFEDPEMKLKGKLLLIAFPSFCIGAFLDATMPTTALTLIIFRLILISSAVEFYSAFILPGWIKKIFL